jgi:hypothetical protein
MNYKYNELKYAELIYNEGFKTKYFLTELKLLVLYYRDILKYDCEKIELEVNNFCKIYIPNFKKEKFFKIINAAIKISTNKNKKLINIDKILITKCEIDYINNLDVKYEYKKIMFTFLVQMKLNKFVYELNNKDVYTNIFFEGGNKKYNNIKKMAYINNKISMHDEVINELSKLGLITILHRGLIILDYLKNCIECDNIIFEIKNFEHVGLYLDYYNNIDKVKKCENCENIIKAKNNKTKYCDECAEEIEKENHKERNRKWYKNKISDEIEKP